MGVSVMLNESLYCPRFGARIILRWCPGDKLPFVRSDLAFQRRLLALFLRRTSRAVSGRSRFWGSRSSRRGWFLRKKRV